MSGRRAPLLLAATPLLSSPRCGNCNSHAGSHRVAQPAHQHFPPFTQSTETWIVWKFSGNQNLKIISPDFFLRNKGFYIPHSHKYFYNHFSSQMLPMFLHCPIPFFLGGRRSSIHPWQYPPPPYQYPEPEQHNGGQKPERL